jgi:hypothetical protein
VIAGWIVVVGPDESLHALDVVSTMTTRSIFMGAWRRWMVII